MKSKWSSAAKRFKSTGDDFFLSSIKMRVKYAYEDIYIM